MPLFFGCCHDPGDVTGGLGEEVHEIDPEARLNRADNQEVGELSGKDSVEGVGTIGPALAQGHAISAGRIEAEPLFERGRDLETGREDEQVDGVLDTVEHDACLRHVVNHRDRRYRRGGRSLR